MAKMLQIRKEKMKTTQSFIEQPTRQRHNYDTLLEELLPVIHKAAHLVQGKQQTKDISKDLRLAGLRGFKEMFLQLNNLSLHGEPRKMLLQAINSSMQEQIRINGSSLGF